MSSNANNWALFRQTKTEKFNYLLDYLFEKWNMNKENEFRGYKPEDLQFRHYHCTDKWHDKEAYSFSLSSYLWFDGRVYNHNEGKSDLFILFCTKKLTSDGIHTIYQDLDVYDA